MTALPLQLVDNFIQPYNVGQALLAFFVLSTLGALPLGSRKVLSINTLIFGLVFLVTPASMAPVHYRYLGVILLVVAPVLFTTARG